VQPADPTPESEEENKGGGVFARYRVGVGAVTSNKKDRGGVFTPDGEGSGALLYICISIYININIYIYIYIYIYI